jgi:hypothetical protein
MTAGQLPDCDINNLSSTPEIRNLIIVFVGSDDVSVKSGE